MQKIIRIRGAGSVKKHLAQHGRRAPSLVLAKNGSKCLPRHVETAAFVAEQVTPSTDSCDLAIGIAAVRYRTCSRDRDDPWFASGCPRQGNQRVDGNDVKLCRNEFPKIGIFVGGAAAETRTNGLEGESSPVELSFITSLSETSVDGVKEFCPTFAGCNMVARTAMA